MRFWDTSVVTPLTIAEDSSDTLFSLLQADRRIVVWWATRVECVSALARRVREGALSVADEQQAREALTILARSWIEVLPTERVRTLAERLLAVHPIRAADALQLAAAIRWCEGEPVGRYFVSLDHRLREAARREGFSVLPGQAQLNE